MLTLKRILKEIETFATNHEIIKTWVFGDAWEANAKHEITYPLMFGMIRPSTLNENTETFTLEIFFCDLEQTNKENTAEVLSDMKQLINDFCAYFTQESFTDYFKINDDINEEPFIQSFNDHCAGWSFSVTFTHPYDKNLCRVPYSGSPAPSLGSYAIIKDQDGNVVKQLKAGEIYNVIIATGIDEGDSTTAYSIQIVDIN